MCSFSLRLGRDEQFLMNEKFIALDYGTADLDLNQHSASASRLQSIRKRLTLQKKHFYNHKL